jgi:nucleoid DNA-binding protein
MTTVNLQKVFMDTMIENGVSERQSRRAVRNIFELMEDALIDEDATIVIERIGVIKRVETTGQTARNPKTGEVLVYPEGVRRTRPKLKPSLSLVKAIRKHEGWLDLSTADESTAQEAHEAGDEE